MESKKSLFEKLGLKEKIQYAPEEETEETTLDEATENLHKKITAPTDNVSSFMFDAAPKNTSFKFDKHNDIKEIYNIYNLKLDGINTIFTIENFLKALPESLAEDVKRQSLFDIIKYSGMNIETLIADGSERLKSLNSFFDQFSTNTNKNIQEREKEIEALVKKINQYKIEIDDLKQLKDSQKSTIDYETQRVGNIIQFVKPS